MKKTQLLKPFLMLLSMHSMAIFALSSAPQVTSRNMPQTCEYVFQVESDIQINVEDVIKSTPQASSYRVHTRFVNAYNESETNIEPNSHSLTTEASSLSLTLMSFQASQKRLLRKIIFSVEAIGADGQIIERFPSEASMFYISEFGRDFGEACHPGGRAYTPWRVRPVSNFQN